MAKLKREQFRQLFPTASITDWVKYRYINGKVDCVKFWNVAEHNHLEINQGPDYGKPVTYYGRIATLNKINVKDLATVKITYTAALENVSFMYSKFKDDVCIARVAGLTSGYTFNVSDADYIYLAFYKETPVQSLHISDVQISDIEVTEVE